MRYGKDKKMVNRKVYDEGMLSLSTFLSGNPALTIGDSSVNTTKLSVENWSSMNDRGGIYAARYFALYWQII